MLACVSLSIILALNSCGRTRLFRRNEPISSQAAGEELFWTFFSEVIFLSLLLLLLFLHHLDEVSALLLALTLLFLYFLGAE